jgi:hypothetical protein
LFSWPVTSTIIDGGHCALVGVHRRKFIGALERYNVRGVVLVRGVEETTGVLPTLTIAGFHEAKQYPSFIVYLRRAVAGKDADLQLIAYSPAKKLQIACPA